MLNQDDAHFMTLAPQLEQNFLAKVRYLPSLCPSMRLVTLPSTPTPAIVAVDSTMASDTFNVVTTLPTSMPFALEDIHTILAYFEQRRLPFAWWVGPSALEQHLDQQLAACGLTLMETEQGMALSLTAVAATQQLTWPTDFRIKAVQTPEDFQVWGQVLASVFDPVDTEAIRFYTHMASYLPSERPAQWFLGYFQDEPVAIVSIMQAAGLGGLYDVVTKPAYQGRGFGRLMTQFAMARLHTLGAEVIGLQASAAGASLYQQLGFRPVGWFKVYGVAVQP